MHAALQAYGITFEALGDDGLVIGGQPEKLSLVVANRGGSPVTVAGVDVAGFSGPASCSTGAVTAGGVYTCTPTLSACPLDASLTTRYWTDDYWGVTPPGPALQIYPKDVPFGAPFRPTPFRATFHLKAGSAPISARTCPSTTATWRIRSLGEKRMELNVVPAFSVRT